MTLLILQLFCDDYLKTQRIEGKKELFLTDYYTMFILQLFCYKCHAHQRVKRRRN